MTNAPLRIRFVHVEIGSLVANSGVKVVTADEFQYEFAVVDGPGLELLASDDPAVSAHPTGLRVIFDQAGRPTLRSGKALRIGRLGVNGISFQDLHELAEITALEIKRPVR